MHVVIPTPNPWVPLRILGLGAAADAPVEADVYLLTDIEPAMLPAPLAPGVASGSRDVPPGPDPRSRARRLDARSSPTCGPTRA